MKSFEYIEMIFDGVLFRATSTDTQVIEWIQKEVSRLNLAGRKGTVEISKMDNHPYYIKVLQGDKQIKDLPGTYWFAWYVVRELCHKGWEPLPRSDSETRIALRLEVIEEQAL